MKKEDKKKIVIVGGGFAGSAVAKQLENHFSVELIDTKDYFEFTPGILRTLVEPEHAKKIQIMYKDYLKNTRIIVDCVLNANKRFVYTKSRKIAYDYLVVCSGSSYKAPIKEQDVVFATRAKNLVDIHKRLGKAKEIAIIGGGLVGVELAAEIACRYGDKKITMVHSGDKLMDRNSKKSIDYATKFLLRNGVKIIFEERVVGGEKKEIETDKGTKIKCDLVFSCTGIIPNSDFLKNSEDFAIFLDEKGFVNVNDYMQVNGFRNVFALGDINACMVEKTAQNAELQAEVAVENIRALESGRKLKKYVEKKTPMVISLGKYDGIFDYMHFVFTGKVPAFLKWAVEKKEMWNLGS
ncbi:MAG: FAD-dependent oxidoreductase [Nanoarchaeota archaeon]